MKQVVYVASPDSKEIYVWKLKEDGTLMLLQIIFVAAQVQPMVISPKKDFLYVGVRPNFRILSYQIMLNGCLKLIDSAPLPGSPTYISIDRHRKYLFCSSYNNACLSISPIDKNGLPLAPSQVIINLDGCHSANIDLSNKILFVAALKQDCIYLFQLNSTGFLTPYKQSQISTVKGAGPRHITFHPNGKYVYCVNELDSTVTVWNINKEDEKIKCVQNLNIIPKDLVDKNWASDIHITPDGKFLYTSERTSSTLTIFNISKDGAALDIKGFQPTEKQPRGFTIDNSGRYLLVAGQKSHSIAVYRIQKNGLLTLLMSYATGQGPMWIVINRFD